MKDFDLSEKNLVGCGGIMSNPFVKLIIRHSKKLQMQWSGVHRRFGMFRLKYYTTYLQP